MHHRHRHRIGLRDRQGQGSAHEIAATIAFIASTEASYLTGESIVVDGGMLLMAAVANQMES